MRIYVGFDDTDTIDAERGTGKLARWFEQTIPEGGRLWGVVRQQLLLDPGIPYTSHNSSACAVIDCEERTPMIDLIIEKAIAHIEKYALPGSDSGLCVVSDADPCLPALKRFGINCTRVIMTQEDSLKAVNGSHLSGHGGTSDGIIGAAAAVGLTANGWSGRFIEFGGLRNYPPQATVGELAEKGINTVTIDRDAQMPSSDDIIETSGWLRPRLIGGRPVLLVTAKGEGLWESIGKKRNSTKKEVK